jgi:inosose dehydratase
MQIRVANAPASWGVEDPGDPANPDWADVVEQVAAAGYAGIELGPVGYMPEDPSLLRPVLADHGLHLVGGFLFEPLESRDGTAQVLAAARRTCQAVAAAGGTHLVVIQGFTPGRERAAGRRRDAVQLSPGEWRTLIDSIHSVSRLASKHGLEPCFHPHAGTAVEFEDEIERVIADTDPDIVSICVDTGHCAYAGVDPVELCDRHASRISYLHLKDIDRARLDEALRMELGFEEAVAHGVFCPLGQGVVDFGALRVVLERHSFDGWGTVEQDRLPTGSTEPAAEAAASLAHLRGVGLAA